MNDKIRNIIVLVIVVVLAGSIYLYKYIKDSKEYGLSVYFFNAGKADCILISNNDKHIMIDTGEEELSVDILEYLKNNNINKIDYLIITHFDKDHVGSAASIINNIEISNVLQSNVPKESKYYEKYIEALTNKGLNPQTIEGNVAFELGDLKFIVNGPEKKYDNNESNNSSLIVSVKYVNTDFLFMGDAQNSRIKDFLAQNDAKYDFIKIPYHGHYQKRLEDLLKVTMPKYAVITCSKEEPEDVETIKLLMSLKINYYLTKNGSIKIVSDGNEVRKSNYMVHK